MVEFLVDFQDLQLDDRISVQDKREVKKPLKRGDFAKVYDATGNSCHGIIDRVDDRTRIIWVALDKSTWKDAILA